MTPDPQRVPDLLARAFAPLRAARFTSRGSALALLLAAVAAVLRFFSLGSQIPLQDEWHALIRSAQFGFRAIARSLGANDHSIPWTLYLELVDRTFGLNEFWLYIPGAVVALILTLALPALLRREIGAPVAWMWLALLASSPTLVFYARQARPYGFTALLAPLAVLFWHRATSGDARQCERSQGSTRAERRYRIAFVVATALVGWTLAPHLPFILAPVALGVLSRTTDGSSWRSRLGLAAAAAATLVALLGPPVVLDWQSLGFKFGAAGAQPWSLATTVPARLLGLTWQPLVIFLFGLTVIGLFSQARFETWKSRSPLLLLALGSAAQVAAVVALRPLGTSNEVVFARYILPVLPMLLLAVAIGTARLCGGWIARRTVTGVLCVTLVVVQVLASPLPAIFRLPNNFGTLAGVGQPPPRILFLNPVLEDRIAHRTLSPFYLGLRREPPGSQTVIEAPYTGFTWLPYRAFQVHHRQHVIGGLLPPACEPGPDIGDGLRPGTVRKFRYLVDVSDREAVRRKHADWLILHRSPGSNPRLQGSGEAVAAFDVERCSAYLETLYGVPAIDEATGRIFDLRGARAR